MPPRTPHSVTAEVESVLGPAPASYSQPEIVVLRFRRNGWRLFWPVLVLVAAAAGGGFWVGALPSPWMNVLAGIGIGLAALLFGLIPILTWLASRTTVTSHRVIVRRGLMASHRSEISLAHVREVRLRRGPLQRLQGSGSIDLLHGSEVFRLRDVPGVNLTAEALRDLMERNYEHATRAQRAAGGDASGPVSFW
ncbi:MAG: PH domain-containing protein [Leucobacter sp.]